MSDSDSDEAPETYSQNEAAALAKRLLEEQDTAQSAQASKRRKRTSTKVRADAIEDELPADLLQSAADEIEEEANEELAAAERQAIALENAMQRELRHMRFQQQQKTREKKKSGRRDNFQLHVLGKADLAKTMRASSDAKSFTDRLMGNRTRAKNGTLTKKKQIGAAKLFKIK